MSEHSKWSYILTPADGWPRMLAKLFFILSPIMVTTILAHYYSAKYNVPYGNEAIGLALFGAYVIEAPLVAIVGGLFSLAISKRPNAKNLSVYGYAVPAIIICGYLITHP